MIQNRLIVPQQNNLRFVLDHTENDEKYNLAENSRYYIIISESAEPFEKRLFHKSESEYFNVFINLPDGEYVFEIGIIDENDKRTVILPALDERLRPLNQLLVLRRLKNE